MLGPAAIICARRRRASRGSTGWLPGGGAGGGSSHCGRLFQTSRPAPARGFLVGVIDAEGGQHRIAPRPLAARHGRGGILELGRGQRRHVFQLVEQRARHLGQGGHFFFRRGRHAKIERFAEPARRRQTEARRPHEGEEFQKVARRQVVQPEPRRDRRRMADQRQAARRAHRRVGRRQPLDRRRRPRATTRRARSRSGLARAKGEITREVDSIGQLADAVIVRCL